jgi:serine/threonine-protein phosphatase 5
MRAMDTSYVLTAVGGQRVKSANGSVVTMSEMAAISSEVVEKANALKDEGNEFLKAHRYAQAAEKYSAAIDLYPTAIFYSNRAQAMIKLESYGLAIQDANEALK